MNKCPYCNAPMKTNGYNFVMSERRAAMFRRILHAGQEGIGRDVLIKHFNIKKPATLRTHIFYINKAIAPLHIRGRNGFIRVEEQPNRHG